MDFAEDAPAASAGPASASAAAAAAAAAAGSAADSAPVKKRSRVGERHKTVTYQVKAEAVKAIQSRSKTQKLVADQLGVARSTVSAWVKHAARIQQHADLEQQRLRDELYPEVNKAYVFGRLAAMDGSPRNLGQLQSLQHHAARNSEGCCD